ncbi:MAG: ABC transporter ATP-binding protein, partial [Lachnospiraceae bacterium]|nr:ABC transporter ATP-binding protein [Lachnospiraceae bacterium]
MGKKHDKNKINPQDASEKQPFFNSLHKLRTKVKDGTYKEILDDWKWIFTYSKRYTGAIFLYTFLGLFSSTFAMVASVASKYVIDIITGHKTEQLALMIALVVGGAVFSLAFRSIINRLSAKLSINIHNDIQADIFDQIIDVDWKAINAYSSGDILNRFNSDVSTVSQNAISWLPSIIIALYNFVLTFVVIWHYNKIMSLIAFATAPVMLLMSKYLIRKQREYAKKVKEIGSGMMAFEIETFYNFDTIKSFGVTKTFGQRLRDWQKR